MYFILDKDLTNEKILSVYQNSCKKHNTIELDIIKNQIQVSFRNWCVFFFVVD